MGRLKADSAERIIELRKARVNRHFIQQIIIEEGFKQTSITTVDNYMAKADCGDYERERHIEVPIELWDTICRYFSMKDEIKVAASSILDSIKCSEDNN